MRVPLLFLYLISIMFHVPAQTIHPDYIDGKIYFKFKNSTSIVLQKFDVNQGVNKQDNFYPQFPLLNQLIQQYHVTLVRSPFVVLEEEALDKTYELRFLDFEKAEEILAALNGDENIEYAERAPLYRQQSVPPDDVHANQWYLSKIKAEEAWNLSVGSPNVVVAIVDGGSWMTHSDLAANRWVNMGEIPGNSIDDDANGYVDDVYGYDVADKDNNPIPPSSESHGTMIAGCISAATNNGNGIASIGYNVKIMDVKVKTDGGCFCYAEDGVAYAIAAGADVINMSYGGAPFSTTTQNLMNTAWSKGIVLVASAGNYGQTSLFYPAAYSHVIAVGETNQSDVVDVNSNYGTWVDLMAPGIGIYSTYPQNTYNTADGTSYSAPIVAGTAALMLSFNPNITNDNIDTCLRKGCDNIDVQNPSKVGKMGGGRLNAYNAMLCSQPSSVQKIVPEDHSKVWPNPAADVIYISANTNQLPVLLNVMGQEINNISFKKNSSQNGFSATISSLPQGIYFLKSGSAYFKIIKNK